MSSLSSLNSTMLSAASALQSFQYALNVTQNNIDNASTPDFAKQTVALQADPFNPAVGLGGGVSPGPLVDSRDLLAESDVWQQAGAQGDASAQSGALTAVQNALPVSAGAGIPAALTTFFSDVSAWSAAPTSSTAQRDVMVAAGSLAQSFQTTAAAVSSASQSVSQEIGSTVSQINQATGQIATLNASIQNGGAHDAGMQAQVYSALETLSGLVNINVLQQPDGSVNVTLSSGAALVMGDRQYALTAGNAAATGQSVDPLAPPDIDIYAADGSVVNSQISSGSLAGLLQVRNVTIPGLIGDASQPGALNTLAAQIAGDVNGIVSQGSVPPRPGRVHHGGESKHDRQPVAARRPEWRRQWRATGARGAGQLPPRQSGLDRLLRVLRKYRRAGRVPIEPGPEQSDHHRADPGPGAKHAPE